MKPEEEGQERHNQPVDLADADKDFFNYLDTLLAEIDESAEIESKPQTQVTTSGAATHYQEASTQHQEVDLRPTSGTCDEPTREKRPGEGATIPRWANTPFQVLMFEVCGITLGVPLISLTGILKWNESLCRLPGQPVWHLGVLAHRSQRVVAVDTGRLIMPERIDPEVERQAVSGSHLLLIGEGDFGLLIDKIRTTVKMDKEDVHWRQVAGIQSWWAGIIIGELAVLLNVDALLEMIQEA